MRMVAGTGSGHLPVRAARSMPGESLDILAAAWSGELVHHYGPHYTTGGIQFLPGPVQWPGVPVWAAGFPGSVTVRH